MYLLKANNATYGINLFSDIHELTPEVLKEFTKNVELSEHYVIICNAYKTTLFNIATEVGSPNSKNTTMQIIPIIAKVSDNVTNPVKRIDIVGMRPIIAPTSIERGHQLFIPTASSMSAIIGYFKKYNDLRVQCIQKKYKGNIVNCLDNTAAAYDDIILEDNKTPIYILDFKIVAKSDIVAIVPIDNIIDDPCYYKANKDI